MVHKCWAAKEYETFFFIPWVKGIFSNIKNIDVIIINIDISIIVNIIRIKKKIKVKGKHAR